MNLAGRLEKIAPAECVSPIVDEDGVALDADVPRCWQCDCILYDPVLLTCPHLFDRLCLVRVCAARENGTLTCAVGGCSGVPLLTSSGSLKVNLRIFERLRGPALRSSWRRRQIRAQADAASELESLRPFLLSSITVVSDIVFLHSRLTGAIHTLSTHTNVTRALDLLRYGAKYGGSRCGSTVDFLFGGSSSGVVGAVMADGYVMAVCLDHQSPAAVSLSFPSVELPASAGPRSWHASGPRREEENAAAKACGSFGSDLFGYYCLPAGILSSPVVAGATTADCLMLVQRCGTAVAIPYAFCERRYVSASELTSSVASPICPYAMSSGDSVTPPRLQEPEMGAPFPAAHHHSNAHKAAMLAAALRKCRHSTSLRRIAVPSPFTSPVRNTYGDFCWRNKPLPSRSASPVNHLLLLEPLVAVGCVSSCEEYGVAAIASGWRHALLLSKVTGFLCLLCPDGANAPILGRVAEQPFVCVAASSTHGLAALATGGIVCIPFGSDSARHLQGGIPAGLSGGAALPQQSTLTLPPSDFQTFSLSQPSSSPLSIPRGETRNPNHPVINRGDAETQVSMRLVNTSSAIAIPHDLLPFYVPVSSPISGDLPVICSGRLVRGLVSSQNLSAAVTEPPFYGGESCDSSDSMQAVELPSQITTDTAHSARKQNRKKGQAVACVADTCSQCTADASKTQPCRTRSSSSEFYFWGPDVERSIPRSVRDVQLKTVMLGTVTGYGSRYNDDALVGWGPCGPFSLFDLSPAVLCLLADIARQRKCIAAVYTAKDSSSTVPLIVAPSRSLLPSRYEVVAARAAQNWDAAMSWYETVSDVRSLGPTRGNCSPDAANCKRRRFQRSIQTVASSNAQLTSTVQSEDSSFRPSATRPSRRVSRSSRKCLTVGPILAPPISVLMALLGVSTASCAMNEVLTPQLQFNALSFIGPWR